MSVIVTNAVMPILLPVILLAWLIKDAVPVRSELTKERRTSTTLTLLLCGKKLLQETLLLLWLARVLYALFSVLMILQIFQIVSVPLVPLSWVILFLVSNC